MSHKKLLIERLCNRLGYQFNDPSLLKLALTHRSGANKHNERLEFLGDSILGMVIAEHLFTHLKKADEGQLTRLRASLVKGKTLAEIAKELELGECLYLGEGELKSGGFRRASILADALEAIIGAIYKDAGFELTRKVILGLYQKRLESVDLKSVQKDPKTQLQEWLQSRKLPLPEYELLKVTGEPHKQTFDVACILAEKKVKTHGSGSSRRNAEQQAAEKALAIILDGN
ncbi:ribonuclease III [Kangiella sp.]|uniref:ribonuclease III n=1 Tax=Kangiella sp. TaxID=1920245 RepID=UPI0019927FFF|nr:ribonuclease III [Kangiella sp.]MBD3653574.1 ribonuclease III [Kangiella sp.]